MKDPEGSKLEELNKAVEILKKGGVVVFPTDTVYGIGCKWDNYGAIARIRNIKNSKQYFPVLIANIKQAHEIGRITPLALQLMNTYWPGGLTILVKSIKNDEKVGIRMPASETVKYLIEKLGSPIIGTSANLHGQKSPINSNEINEKIAKMVDLVISGECEKGVESTVIDSTATPMRILRSGAVKIT